MTTAEFINETIPRPEGSRSPVSLPEQPTRARKKPGKCGRPCPDGRPCCLAGEIEHTLCICNNEECGCHEESRYLEALKAGR